MPRLEPTIPPKGRPPKRDATPSQPAGRFHVPPHVAWPLFVVGLMLLGVGSAVGTFFAARSDGGAQVIEDYHQRAVTWNETLAKRAASAALGWKVTLDVGPLDVQPPLRSVEVYVQDAGGQPVAGLSGVIRASRPSLAQPIATLPLQAVPGAPGLYRQQMPLQAAGLWDFEIEAQRDTVQFQTRLRRELSP